MRFAYLIAIHRNFEQFQRLFRAIYSPLDVYTVHVDRKSPAELHARVDEFLRPYENAQPLPSIRCMWGGWSQVRVQLRAIEQLLATSAWDYFINLSGQDFPIRPLDELRAFLDQHKGQNFVHVQDPEREWPGALVRIRYYYLELHVRPLWRPIWVPLPRRPPSWKHYAGSQWAYLTREFCEWLVGPKNQDLQRFYRTTLVPDEGFVQTAIMRGPFRETVVNDNYRAIELRGRTHPKIWTIADFDALRSSGKFFARKFDPATDERILAALEAHVRGQPQPAGLTELTGTTGPGQAAPS